MQGLCELQRRVAAGRNQRTHIDRAYLLDGAVGRLDVRSPVHNCCIEPVRDRGERGQLPAAEMAREEQGRLAVIPELIEQFLCPRRELDATWSFGMIGVVVPDVVEMREFGADAAEIIPDARENGLDLFRRLF